MSISGFTGLKDEQDFNKLSGSRLLKLVSIRIFLIDRLAGFFVWLM